LRRKYYILSWIELPLKSLAGKEEIREGMLTSNFRGRYGHSRGSERLSIECL
jgi:hypothetical protein